MTPDFYSAQEQLRDGRPVKIRALRPNDEASMLAASDRTDAESRRRRFFVAKREFSEQQRSFFMHIDFVNHVALVAEIDEGGRIAIIGGGRYVMVGSGQAEVAFTVVDAYQGQGVGTLLTRHLVGLARAAGLRLLSAEVLPENASMRKVLEKFGFQARSRDSQAIHLTLPLI